MVKALQHVGWRHAACVSGRQLQGQRQPVQSLADGGHSPSAGLIQSEGGISVLTAVDEETDRIRLGETGDAVDSFALSTKGLSAGGQDA